MTRPLTKLQAKKQLAQRRGLTIVAIVEAKRELLDQIRRAACIHCRIAIPLNKDGSRHRSDGRPYCTATFLAQFERKTLTNGSAT